VDTADRQVEVALGALEAGIFTLDQARLLGLARRDIERKIRVGEWQRVGNGVLEATPRTVGRWDRERHALARMGDKAVLSHLTAASIHGLPLPVPVQEVDVTVPRNVKRPAPPGVTVHHRRIDRSDCAVSDGLLVTSVARTVLDAALVLPKIDAVVAADAALRRRTTEFGELVSKARDLRHHRHAARLADFVALLDPRSGSVPESRLRVGLIDAGLPAPVTQYEVWVDERKIATVDFAWPAYKLILEVDGLRYHSADKAFRRDRVRQNELVQAGWRVLRVTALDVERVLAYVIDQVRRALGL
jgi:hypothetical protein